MNSCTRVSVLGFLVGSGWLELVLLLLLKLGLVRRGLNRLYYTTVLSTPERSESKDGSCLRCCRSVFLKTYIFTRF